MKKKRISTPARCVLLVLSLLLSFSMVSCVTYGDILDWYGIEVTTVESTEASTTQTEGTTEGSETVWIPENGSNSSGAEENTVHDVSAAANKGLRSAVSVYATFTVNGYWGSTTTGTSAGSGVIYRFNEETGSAFIITNYHVVYNSASVTKDGISDEIAIFLYGMESSEYAIPATYVGGSMNYDIAVLYVAENPIMQTAAKNRSVAAVTIADSDQVQVGTTAIAIGNPESSGISVTTGIVSVDSEYIGMTGSDGKSTVSFRVIRIDTAVNSGNSGGGLFNGNGDLIGIVNAKVTASDVENIGYAIPSNIARAIADNIVDYCFGKECKTVMRGILGISIGVSGLTTSYDPETGILRKYERVVVAEVVSGGLGSEILVVGDIVKAISVGEKTVEVTRQHHLIDLMLEVRVGDTVTITVERDGEEMTVQTVITEACLTAY